MTSKNPPLTSKAAVATDAKGRLCELVEAHFDFIWRTVRRLGVAGADTDDATQQVFLVALRRLDVIDPKKERSFLYGVAVRISRAHRRKGRSRREEPLPSEPLPSTLPAPDHVAAARQGVRQLQTILDELPQPLREVLVLVEIEELSTPVVAELLSIPRGTVCSRLRRARAAFREAVVRQQESER